MTLRQKQSRFTLMVGKLIIWAYKNGYELSFGDAYVSTRTGHKRSSLHYDRLAIDLNLFRDGEYLEDTEEHFPLGEKWESMGGTWGGRYDDGNHYSYAHGGRK